MSATDRTDLAAGGTVQNGALSPSGSEQHPQHLRALAYGNEIKAAVVNVRRQIRQLPEPDGLRFAAAVVERNQHPENRIRVGDLLRSVHRFGPARTNSFLRELPMSEFKRVSEMTDRQRRVITERLRKASGS